MASKVTVPKPALQKTKSVAIPKVSTGLTKVPTIKGSVTPGLSNYLKASKLV